MSDERVRELGRRWREDKGNRKLATEYLRERIRTGELTQREVHMAWDIVQMDGVLKRVQGALIGLANLDIQDASLRYPTRTPLRGPIAAGFDEKGGPHSDHPATAVLQYLDQCNGLFVYEEPEVRIPLSPCCPIRQAI